MPSRPSISVPACESGALVSTPPLKAIDARGAALALLLSILWGANPVAIKVGLEDAPPIRLAWMRFLGGGAVIVVWG